MVQCQGRQVFESFRRHGARRVEADTTGLGVLGLLAEEVDLHSNGRVARNLHRPEAFQSLSQESGRLDGDELWSSSARHLVFHHEVDIPRQ